MRRAVIAGSLLAVSLLSACGPQPASDPAPSPAPVTATPPTSPSAAPSDTTAPASPDASPSTTDPAVLDQALLQPGQLAGWQKADSSDLPVDATTDPAACATLYQQTVGKVASDMGATAAYTKDSLFLQEYLDLVDSGSTSLDDLERVVGQCKTFTADENGEKTQYTAEPVQVPQLGDRSFGVRLGVQGDGPGELMYVWVAHKDVLMLMHIDGEKVDPTLATQLTGQAAEKLIRTVG